MRRCLVAANLSEQPREVALDLVTIGIAPGWRLAPLDDRDLSDGGSQRPCDSKGMDTSGCV